MSVFDFVDYKRFLRAYLASLPKKGRGEITRLAAHMKVHPTLVSQVIGGAKDFTIEQVQSVCRYFGLPSLETDYLILLVQIERAGTEDLKRYYREKLADVKGKSLTMTHRLKEHRALSDADRAVFYSSWIYSAVRLFTSVGNGQTLEAVTAKFNLPRGEAVEILRFLTDTGLCIEANGIYSMGTLHTHVDSRSPFLKRHHSNWRLQALQRSDRITPEEMMFTSAFSISRDDFAHIREEIVKVIQRTSQTIRESPADEVACMNIDLFWVGRSSG